MKSNLYSLTKLFTDRIFRIPDYQRGYAWQTKHISDFWMDVQNIKDDRYHYAGVITLEEVPLPTYREWTNDYWIIKSKRFEPYYIVNGQQRLTTAIILLQAIIESTPTDQELNFTRIEKIRERFIYETKDGGVSRSYLFGYARDDFSYEFLKSAIFGEEKDKLLDNGETIYTQNLESAKRYFKNKLQELNRQSIEKIYEKLTQQVLFNVYTINDDIDVCMAFETMNNRGRPLTQLELLKNRLIYLSTKIECDGTERGTLRQAINESWKSIYHYLGKNKNSPLDDDKFLKSHFAIYFSSKISSKAAEDCYFDSRKLDRYGQLLLSEIFIESRIENSTESQQLGVEDIFKFARHIGRAAEAWYYIHNPDTSKFSKHETNLLEQLNRIGIGNHAALILCFVLNNEPTENRTNLLKYLEKLSFYDSLGFRSSYYSYSHGYYRSRFDSYHPAFSDLLYKYATSLTSAHQLLNQLHEKIASFTSNQDYTKDVRNAFRASGFYGWDGIRYFLFEYEQFLAERSRTNTSKLKWEELEWNDNFSTVEHIYPQNARRQYWTDRFPSLTQQQRESLRNSLGNLLPMPRGKNSTLSNLPFHEKIDNGKSCGYRFGTFSEIEVSKEDNWTPNHILTRGMLMLDFMERRWGIKLGSYREKKDMLGLSFIPTDNEGTTSLGRSG